MSTERDLFKILVLDGGGSKGVYTLGVLKELELKLGGRLYQHFKLIYGTSTGSIIAALIASGKSIPEIEALYFTLIPTIMKGWRKGGRSARLKQQADSTFGLAKFDSFKTDIGIVAMNFDEQKPLIFKSNIVQAHGMKHSFEEGFGCTISDAVQCSCSAYPVFNIKSVKLSNKGSETTVRTIDGGFIANNASLFAMIDAHKAYKIKEEDVRLLNIGVGSYIDKPIGGMNHVVKFFDKQQLIERVFSANTNTNVQTFRLLFPHLNYVRISETFAEPQYGTNMLEKDTKKLKKMFELGRTSFAKFEKDIDKILAH